MSRAGVARRYAVKTLDTGLRRLGAQCHLSGNVLKEVQKLGDNQQTSEAHPEVVPQPNLMPMAGQLLFAQWLMCEFMFGRMASIVFLASQFSSRRACRGYAQ